MALTTLPVVTSPGGHPTEATPVITVGPDGSYVAPGGAGGGGGGDASAANQVAGNDTLAAILAALGVALPLPTGAATAAAQATANAALASILTAFGPLATAGRQDTGNASLAAIAAALAAALPLPTGASTAANQSTGNASLAAIAAALAGILGVVPQMASGGHLAVTTAAGGTTFTAFASQACKQLTIINNTGTLLEAQQGGSGVAVPLFTGQAFTFFGLTNASQIGLRRVDQSTVTVTAQARWEA